MVISSPESLRLHNVVGFPGPVAELGAALAGGQIQRQSRDARDSEAILDAHDFHRSVLSIVVRLTRPHAVGTGAARWFESAFCPTPV